MTTIESNEALVNKSAQEVYYFLSDFRNFEKLMPEQVVNWIADENECSFTIKGMASLGMKIKNKTPNSLIEIESSGKTPFGFVMKCMIAEKQNQSVVKLAIEAELNPMLKMMAEKPLTNFLNLLVTKLAEVSAQA